MLVSAITPVTLAPCLPLRPHYFDVYVCRCDDPTETRTVRIRTTFGPEGARRVALRAVRALGPDWAESAVSIVSVIEIPL
jgi:hypothetical protein